MPEAWAKAFAPTTALLGCTTNPVIWDTRREAGTIWLVSIRVSRLKKSPRVRTAITTSSSEVLPARSPRPFIVHSIWRTPPIVTAASEFATAMPRSLWQCTDHTALPEFGTFSRSFLMNSPNCSGTAYPTVSGMLMVVAPSLITDSITRQRKSGSERLAASGENSMSSRCLRAKRTDSVACSSTCAGVMRSFSSLVIEAPGLCSPSRMVVSNMINLSFMVPLQVRLRKHLRRLLAPRPGPAELGLGLCAREAQQQTRQKQAAEGKAESDGAEMHAGNITGFPGYCNGAGSPRRRFFHSQYTYPDSPYATNSRNSTIGGSVEIRKKPRTISRITANGTERLRLMSLKL